MPKVLPMQRMRRAAAVVAFACGLACQPSPPLAAPEPAPQAAPSVTEPRAEPPPSPEQAASPPPTAFPPPRQWPRSRKPKMAPVGMTAAQIVAHAEASGDPAGGRFTLSEALVGDAALADPNRGDLHAQIITTMGPIDCALLETAAPATVANFVGLAHGVRPWYDYDAKHWRTAPFYDGVIFHRVIAGFMIQGGDRSGTGRQGAGYVIADEHSAAVRHDGPGILSMANRGPNTGDSQFFITVAPTPHLDGRHTVFGRCEPSVAIAISKVPTDGRMGRPTSEIAIQSIRFYRAL